MSLGRASVISGTAHGSSNFLQAEFTNQFNEWLSQHSDISQRIHLEEKEYFSLQEDERLLLNSLMNEQHVIPISTGVLNEKQLIVESGPLQGVESRIKKIDRHQRTAAGSVSDLRSDDVALSIGIDC